MTTCDPHRLSKWRRSHLNPLWNLEYGMSVGLTLKMSPLEGDLWVSVYPRSKRDYHSNGCHHREEEDEVPSSSLSQHRTPTWFLLFFGREKSWSTWILEYQANYIRLSTWTCNCSGRIPHPSQEKHQILKWSIITRNLSTTEQNLILDSWLLDPWSTGEKCWNLMKDQL